ncbi:putative type II NADH dehydrogenase [Haematococcus lacustris]
MLLRTKAGPACTCSPASVTGQTRTARTASGQQAAPRMLSSTMRTARSVATYGLLRSAKYQANQQRWVVKASATGQTGVVGSGPPRIVIVGGGFGGLYTAVRLGSLFWPQGRKPEITLVDQSEHFLFKPLLYELLNGGASEAEVAPPYAHLLAPYPVTFVQGRVVGAEPQVLLKDGGSASGGSVQLEDGSLLEYDWLVLSMGSEADPRDVPGVREHALPFISLADAQQVRGALDAIEVKAAAAAASYPPPASSIVIVGAGYAGVELSAVIAERLRRSGANRSVRVQLVTPGAGILEGSPLGQRQAAEQVLAGLDVEVVTGARVKSMEPSPELAPLLTSALVNLEPGPSTASHTQIDIENPLNPGVDPVPPRAISADLVIWTAGSSPATKSARQGFPFPADARGSVQTDATLRVAGHARVFALGDICVADQGYVQDAASTVGYDAPSRSSSSASATAAFPATAQVAFQQADYVAWNLWAAMAGRPLLPFRYQHLGSMMTLGATNAAVALPVPQLPLPLQSGLQSGPLGPLLNSLGARFTVGDPSSGVTLEGPLAAAIRRAAYLYRQPTNEQRLTVASEWLQQASSLAAGLLQSLSATVAPGASSAAGGSQK